MRIFLLVVLVSLVAPLPAVSALVTPDVTFIPSQLSAGSSFIAVTDGDIDRPVRITWFVGGVSGGHGLFPKVGDNFYCYFSNSDPEANCGPSPFTPLGTGTYEMQVDAWDANGGTANNTETMEVGNLVLRYEITPENGSVNILAWGENKLPDTISYDVIKKSDLSSAVGGFTLLERNPVTGLFSGNFTIPDGEYYVALSAIAGSDFGGDLQALSLGGGGVVCGDTPTPGNYPLVTDSVSIPGLFLSRGGSYNKSGYKIVNEGDFLLGNLTVSVPSGFGDIMDIELLGDSIGVNDTVFFTLKLFNIDDVTTVNTLADILSNGEVVGQISVSISISVGGGGVSCPGGGDITISPNIWTGDYIVGETATKAFNLENNGDSVVTVTDYSASSGIDGIASVSIPSSVSSGGKGTVTVDLDPLSPGNYYGSVDITTSSGTATILVSTRFFNDISSGISSAQDDLDYVKSQMTLDQEVELSLTLSDIDDMLSSASDSFDSGDYAEGDKLLSEARASISTLSSSITVTPDVPDAGETSLPSSSTSFIIIIGAVVAVAVAAVVMFIRRKKSARPPEEDLEEEFESELE